MSQVQQGPMLFTPSYSKRPFTDHRRQHLAGLVNAGDGWHLQLALQTAQSRIVITVPIRPGEAELESTTGKLVAHGLRKLGPGVWVVEPSVEQENLMHAYVVIKDVPDPAPWEA